MENNKFVGSRKKNNILILSYEWKQTLRKNSYKRGLKLSAKVKLSSVAFNIGIKENWGETVERRGNCGTNFLSPNIWLDYC